MPHACCARGAQHRWGILASLPDQTGTAAFPATSPRGEAQTGTAAPSIVQQLRALPKAGTSSEPVPLQFDFDRPPEPPDWIVDRMFEREHVNILSGDTGTGKSILMASLTTAICSDASHWLGRQLSLSTGKVLVIDEENGASVVRRRLHALGLRNADKDSLLYFNRQGFSIGDPVWTERLRVAVSDHKPDLIIIDTATAATNVDVNDNSAVASLYTQALRPIASNLGVAVVVLHHERKPQPNQTRDIGMAAMGARQWIGQADRHIALRVEVPFSEELGSDGLRTTRTELSMVSPKDRMGQTNTKYRIAITSKRDDDDRLLRMQVLNEGIHEREPSKAEQLAERIAQLLRDEGELKRAAISLHLGVDDDGTLDRAFGQAVAAGAIAKPKRGVYAPVDQPAL